MEFISILVTIFLIFATSLTYFIYRRLGESSGFWERQGVPCSRPSLLQYLTILFKPLRMHEQELYKRLGRVYGRYDGLTPVLTVGDPDILKNILVKDFHNFHSRRDMKFGSPILDNNVSILSGDDWKRVRSIISPTFTSGKLRKLVCKLHESASRIIDALHDFETKGASVDLDRIFGAYTLDVIAASAFGTKIDTLKNPNNPFVVHAKKLFASGFSLRCILPVYLPFLMKLFKISMLNPDSLEFFHDFTKQIIEKRKKNDQKRVDYLQLLLDAELNEAEISEEGNAKFENDGQHGKALHGKLNKTLSHNEVASQCVVFFLAGYDSTSSILQFTVYNLAINEEIQERLFEEIYFTLKGKGELSYDDVMNMKYLDAVISESLRMCGACIRMERRAENDYEIGTDGIVIKKGNLISIPIHPIHYDPEFYPEPEKFDPERFTPEAKAARHPFTYLPFGLGPRSCVGSRFALLEIKLCLVLIIQRFKILRCPETKVPLGLKERQGVLLPNKPFVKFETRKTFNIDN